MFSESEIQITESEFQLFRGLVREKTGIALSDSKRALLNTRLLGRLRHLGLESFAQYYEYLHEGDPYGSELQEMTNAITTNMTSFFREAHHFQLLAHQLLLPARQRARRGQPPSMRIWSAGCSSGEEAYSMAITILETLPPVPLWDVKILATDIDTEMVHAAESGTYHRDAVRDLPRPVLAKYFLSGKGDYQGYVRVKPALSKLVTFVHMNLMDEAWPFHHKFDAIFCRNVIIYFDHESQRRLLEHFAAQLKSDGLFFAGHSENLFWLDELLEPMGNTVYRLRKLKKA